MSAFQFLEERIVDVWEAERAGEPKEGERRKLVDEVRRALDEATELHRSQASMPDYATGTRILDNLERALRATQDAFRDPHDGPMLRRFRRPGNPPSRAIEVWVLSARSALMRRKRGQKHPSAVNPQTEQRIRSLVAAEPKALLTEIRLAAAATWQAKRDDDAVGLYCRDLKARLRMERKKASD